MSLHKPEKRLAVLASVVEDGLSERGAARCHGVNRKSVGDWVRSHYSGEMTLGMLRSSGTVPTRPIAPTVAPESPLVREVDGLFAQAGKLREQLESERAGIDAQIKVLQVRREAVSKAIERIDSSIF